MPNFALRADRAAHTANRTNARVAAREPLITSEAGRLAAGAAVLVAIVTLPYLFPVPLSLSLSYVTQFSNRAASLLLIGGSLLFAWLTQGRLAKTDTVQRDSRLSVLSMAVAVCLTVALLWADLYDATVHVYGSESYYNVNRVYMLLSGLRPYRDFEYAYGPLNLYVPALLARLTHRPGVIGYYGWWTFEWVAGVVMLWYIAKWTPFAQRWREWIFWGLVLLRLPSLWSEGAAYTPMRTTGAAFLILAVHQVWTRTLSPWVTALCGLVAVLLGLGISSEQAAGVGFGLAVWFAVLAWKRRAAFPVRVTAAFVAAVAVIAAGAAAMHLFFTARMFSMGAYSFPVAASSTVFLILATYLFSPCGAWERFRKADFDSAMLPLAVGGLAMVPSALGRCDYGHLQIDSPALVAGLAFLTTMPTLRRTWTAAFFCLVGLPMLVTEPQDFGARIGAALRNHASAGRVARARTRPAAQPDSGTSHIVLTAPCPVIYRSPNLNPNLLQTPEQGCLETGYYMGLTNAYTKDALRQKVQELDRVPRRPLLLLDQPMAKALPVAEDDPRILVALEGALVIPPARRAPFDYAELVQYIEHNYTPDPQGVDGLRVWRPKHVN